MPQYRLRLLRPHDHRGRLVELDFPSDEDAISVIQRHVKGPCMELWRGERLIARFQGAPPLASPRGDGAGVQARTQVQGGPIHRSPQAQP